MKKIELIYTVGTFMDGRGIQAETYLTEYDGEEIISSSLLSRNFILVPWSDTGRVGSYHDSLVSRIRKGLQKAGVRGVSKRMIRKTVEKCIGQWTSIETIKEVA